MPMTLVSTVTVGAGGAALIEFNSIPQTGKDLLLLTALRSSANAQETVGVNLNGSLPDNRRELKSLNGNVSSSTNWVVYANGPSTTGSTFSNGSFYVANYAGASNKAVSGDWVQENNATTSFSLGLIAGLRTTGAVTSISVENYSGTWVQHSTASLYIIS